MSKSWILSIGNNSAASLPELNCPEQDAESVFQFFTSNWRVRCDCRVLLTGNKATNRAILTAANSILLSRADFSDRVLIFLSGHLQPDHTDITAWYASSDFNDSAKAKGFNLRSLRHIVEGSTAREIYVIIDGCHAGVIAQGDGNFIPHNLPLTSGQMDSSVGTRVFLASCTSGDQAFEFEGERHSRFTGNLLDVCADACSGNRQLSWLDFVDKVSNSQTQDESLGRPVLSGVVVGSPNFILIRPLTPPPTGQNSDLPDWLVELLNHKEDHNAQDDSSFVADVTYPDNTELSIGQTILKVWRVRNSGTVPWRQRFLEYQGTRGIGSISVPIRTPIPDLNPSEEGDISVQMRMPDYPGEVFGHFRIVSASGALSFPTKRGLYVKFKVVDPR